MAILKANSYKVFNYVMEHEDEDITAHDIAEALDLTDKQVNGIVTMSFQRHKEEVDGNKVEVPLMQRVPAEIQLADGTHKGIKLIKMTDAGRAFEATCGE